MPSHLKVKQRLRMESHGILPTHTNPILRHILSHEHVLEHVTSAILVNLRNLATAYHTACNPPHLQNWIHT